MGIKDYFVEVHADVTYIRNLSEDEVFLIKVFLRDRGINPETASRNDITWAISELHNEGEIDYYQDSWCVESDFCTQYAEYAGDLFDEED